MAKTPKVVCSTVHPAGSPAFWQRRWQDIPLLYPYGSSSCTSVHTIISLLAATLQLILDAYQQSGGMQQCSSSHPQDWYTVRAIVQNLFKSCFLKMEGNDTQQQYDSTSGSDQTMYNRSQAHEFREVNTTSTRDIEPYIKERMDQGQKKFFCGWVGCTHTGKFVRKAQLQTHIKSVHLSEKPFVCTAWYNLNLYILNENCWHSSSFSLSPVKQCFFHQKTGCCSTRRYHE